jgi:MFS family permease
MFFAVLLFFREPRSSAEERVATIRQAARNFCVVLGNYRLVLPVLVIGLVLKIASLVIGFRVSTWAWIGLLALVLAGLNRFMWFLVIFSGYWVVFWQEFIALPLYIHAYIDPRADVEMILITDAAAVICFQVLVSYLTRKIPAFRAITLGALISALSWLIVASYPAVWAAVLSLIVLALGEMTLSPRYYEYISRLAPEGQQGTYMGFAFLPIGIGSLIGGWFGGDLIHHFGEVAHRPDRVWWVITGVGLATALLLWIYDNIFKPGQAVASAN